MKYADDFVLLSKEEVVLRGTTDRLHEIERCYRMEMTVGKTKVKRL
jgi:hypothetical protein